jgi:hypothetical protein
MRIATVGLTAFLVGVSGGGAFAQGSETLGDEIQEQEEPGSEIEAEIGGGEMIIGRERNMPPAEIAPPPAVIAPVAPPPPVVVPGPGLVPRSPIVVEGQAPTDLPNDPDTAVSPDEVDAELPGEGPEDLSGPDDDDPLPE